MYVCFGNVLFMASLCERNQGDDAYFLNKPPMSTTLMQRLPLGLSRVKERMGPLGINDNPAT